LSKIQRPSLTNRSRSSHSTEAVSVPDDDEPHKHCDTTLAGMPMPNYSSTPGGPHGGLPFRFWSSWELNSRPRRIALLLDDCQDEYRPFATHIIPNLVDLAKVFREQQQQVTTTDTETATTQCPLIVWTSWSRTFDDGISNAMDRWYGPHSLRPETSPRMPSTFSRALPEWAVLEEIALSRRKKLKRVVTITRASISTCFGPFAKQRTAYYSYLDEKLQAAGVDTVVIAGLWTDECILATAYRPFGIY
jgi:nicotinamidase-related amidase